MVGSLGSKQGPKLVLRYFAVMENLGHEPWTDCLATVDWNNGDTTVSVLHEMVTAFDSGHAETRFPQSSNHLFACESGQLGH
jgi:hypothetical protein